MNDSVKALAGRASVAHIGVKFLANVKISEAVAWILGGSGVAYGYAQRNLRIGTAKRQGQHIRDLENRLDPKRSSSRFEGG